MEHLQRAKSICRRAPPDHRRIPDQYARPGAVEKGSASVSITVDMESVSQSGCQPHLRPMRSGPALFRTWQEGEKMMPTGHDRPPIDDFGGTGVIAIGMAFGSPTVDHDIFSVSGQPQVVTTVSAPKGNGADEQLPKDGLTRTKSKRWGLFGRSKSQRLKHTDRSHTEPTPPFNATVTRTISNTVSPRGSPCGSARNLPPIASRKPLERSFTEPPTPKTQRYPEILPPDDSIQSYTLDPQTFGGSSETPSREPFLDIKIPDVTLERYSIMFASLLERRGAASPLDSRQKAQDKSWEPREDSENDFLQQVVPASRRNSSEHRVSPLLPPLSFEPVHTRSEANSDTSPVVLTPSHGISKDVDNHDSENSPAPHIMRLASVRGRRPNLPIESQQSEDGRHQLRSKFHVPSPKQESSSSHSKSDLGDLTDECPGQEEPLPPPSKRNGKIAFSGTGTTAMPQNKRSRAAAYTHTTGVQSSSTPSQGSLSEEETGEAGTEVVQDAAQNSSARQISVPSDRRHILGPLRMHPVSGSRPIETDVATFRSIEPNKDVLSPLATCRKNERAVLGRV
ncbi:hypothetical protein E4U41_003290 [Claviceps citrina]|nr:hypothetical protein E4U41_003290 [Claviceps citrina]